MGKPAARIGDNCAHGGVIVMGAPTVLIGGRPASRIGDNHVCPMVTGTVPHVGGPILPPCAFNVLIAGRPAARITDKAFCVGPIDTIVMGEFTVLIGTSPSPVVPAPSLLPRHRDFALRAPQLPTPKPGGPAQDLQKLAGYAAVDAMPDPLAKHAKGIFRVRGKPLAGQLFVDGVSASDVQQGQIGDCYLMAALAAIAHARPDIIENMFEENPDGTYTVKFKRREVEVEVQDTPDGGFTVNRRIVGKDVPVRVDTELPHEAWLLGGGLKYGRSSQKKEQWVPLAEKAYAEEYGAGKGYEGIGHGGWTNEPLVNITGGTSQTIGLDPSTNTDPAALDRQWAVLEDAVANKQPMTASTGKKSIKGIPTTHAYTITGVRVDDKGRRMVDIRNPWGGGKGKRGDFSVTQQQFNKAFSRMEVCTPL